MHIRTTTQRMLFATLSFPILFCLIKDSHGELKLREKESQGHLDSAFEQEVLLLRDLSCLLLFSEKSSQVPQSSSLSPSFSLFFSFFLYFLQPFLPLDLPQNPLPFKPNKWVLILLGVNLPIGPWSKLLQEALTQGLIFAFQSLINCIQVLNLIAFGSSIIFIFRPLIKFYLHLSPSRKIYLHLGP